MKRIIIPILMILLAGGCKSTLKVTNRSDPQAFQPIEVPGHGAVGTVYAELEFDVPDEVSDEDFDIPRAEIYGVVSIEDIAVAGSLEIDIDIYISLEPGQGNLSDTALNQYMTTVTLTDEVTEVPVKFENPEMLIQGLRNGGFYVKIIGSVNENPTSPGDPLLGILLIRDIYFVAWLERATEGLFPIFYVF